MADEPQPPAHDGWKSRKVQLGVASLVAGFGVATVALFVDRAAFAEWSSYTMAYVPLCLGITSGTLTAEKIGLASRQRRS